MFKLLPGILVIFFLSSAVFGQTDSVYAPVPDRPSYRIQDSVTLARRQAYRDSVKHVQDSLSIAWIKTPDPYRPNRFADSLINLYKVENLNFNAWAAKLPKKINRYDEGRLLKKGENWVIVSILFLLVFFALIKFFFSRELTTIIRSFFSNQALWQINKEDNLYNSWPFVFLYLLFGLIIGMYLYLTSRHLGISYSMQGFELFLGLSAFIILLFTAKIIVLRLLGFLFDISRLVREYVSILYLSYFNSALLFLPLIIAFSLTPDRHADIYGYAGIMILIAVFVLQFLRAGANILTNHRFPKVYLIVYLCALEFCPVIILFKALRL